MDVLWFRISRKDADGVEMFGHIEAGRMMVMLDRGDYWQCAYVIPKGGIDRIKAQGLDAFRQRVVAMTPDLADRIGELKSFDDIKLLTVTVDRLRQWWRPGLICIGDAAHAMSPIGGVGVNLAVQDAVAAANQLAAPLKARTISGDDLARHRAAAQLSGPRHAAPAAHHAEPDHRAGARQHRAAEAAAHVQTAQRFSAAAAHPGAPSGPWLPAGACPHAGYGRHRVGFCCVRRANQDVRHCEGR